MSYVIQAVLSNAQHPEYGQVTIPFPIPNQNYDCTIELLEPLEIGDTLRQDCQVDELDSFYTVLNALIGTQVTLDELDYLLASKLAVKTGDVERLRFLMDQAETYILEMEPGFVGRMIRDAYSLNPYIGREMMDYATNEQIAAAPAELMLAAVYNRDSRAAFTLARKGIDITGRASEVIRQYAQRGDTWELEQLIRDGMKIQPTNLSALKACIQADLLGAAKLLLEKGTDYEKFLSWTKTIGYDLPAAAAAELSEHWEQLDLGRAQGQDPGMGGMSLG